MAFGVIGILTIIGVFSEVFEVFASISDSPNLLYYIGYQKLNQNAISFQQSTKTP